MNIPTIIDVQHKILNLPERPPFMTAQALADFYGVGANRIIQQVKRNPNRFPDDFIFEFTSAEKRILILQNEISNRAVRGPGYGFTHKGALALSGVLKTPVADAVSVTIIRAFAALEQRAFDEVNHLLSRLRSDAAGRRPIRSRIIDASREGWTFEQLWRDTSYSRGKIATAMNDCIALGLIDEPLINTPQELFNGVGGHHVG